MPKKSGISSADRRNGWKGKAGGGGAGRKGDAPPPSEDGAMSRKQKRQGKRKRDGDGEDDDDDVPPMPEQGSGSHWNFSATQQVKGDAAGKKSKKGGEGYKVCPAGHPLFLFLTPHDEYVCDACDTGDFLEQGTTMLGCRICDWDACDKCSHPVTLAKEVAKEAAYESKCSAQADAAPTPGEWKSLVGFDKYRNEFMYLRHTGSGVVVELPHYTVGQFEFRPGQGAPGLCVAADGQVAGFEMTLPQLESKLARGGGKSLTKKHTIGNWEVHALGDGGAVASNNFQFVKTSKHVTGNEMKGSSAEGLSINFVCTGEVVWMAPDCYGEKAVIIRAHRKPQSVTREEASEFLAEEPDQE